MGKGPLELLRQVGELLDELEIAWVLGGSLASAMFGEPRSTVDVDVAIRIRPGSIDALIDRAKRDFYVPEAAARTAAREHGSFNLIDTEHGLKVDLFVLGDGLLDQRQLERRRLVTLGAEDRVWVTAPEDQILRKIDWYQLGGMKSDRQWRDVVGLIAVQAGGLDLNDLRETAGTLGLDEVLNAALDEAELG